MRGTDSRAEASCSEAAACGMVRIMTITQDELVARVESLLGVFHQKRLDKLRGLDLKLVLRKKNPYLYRGIGAATAVEVVRQLLEASIASSEETLFGNEFFETLAVWVAERTATATPGMSVQVSSAAGIDFEVHTPTEIRIYAVKSGTSVFNASSKKKQMDEFFAARSRLHKTRKRVEPVIAYAYGRKESRATGTHSEVAGQKFWAEISGEQDLYLRIMQAIEARADAQEGEFVRERKAVARRMTMELLERFSDDEGNLDWIRLVEYNSGATRPKQWARLVKARGA